MDQQLAIPTNGRKFYVTIQRDSRIGWLLGVTIP
jgi:hypothetical protein